MSAAGETSADTRRRDWIPVLARALVAVALLSGGLFVVALIVGIYAQSDNSLAKLAGLTTGAVVLRLAVAQARPVRFALIAQAADLMTFAFAWPAGLAEQNPLAGWAVDAALAALPVDATWFAFLAAGLFLILLKLALAVFLIGVVPHLGRYRTVVLAIAVGAGLIGAASNVLALPWSSLASAAIDS